jgi:hypothetical protein
MMVLSRVCNQMLITPQPAQAAVSSWILVMQIYIYLTLSESTVKQKEMLREVGPRKEQIQVVVYNSFCKDAQPVQSLEERREDKTE